MTLGLRQIVLLLAVTLALALPAHAQGPVRLYNDAQADYLASRYIQAEEKLRLVLKQQKIYPDALFLWGQCRWQQHDYKGAIKWYDRALKQTPTNVEYVFHKGLAYEGMGRTTKAVKYYFAATRIDMGYAMAWKRLGEIFANAGEWKQALEYYSKAVDLDPLDADAFMLRGNAQAALNNLPAAASDYNYVLQQEPKNADAYFNLANVEVRQGRIYEAVKAFGSVLELRPRDRDALLNRGITLLALGLRDQALQDFEAGIDVDSTFAVLWWNKGFLLHELARNPEAMVAARKACALAPADPKNWLLLGRIEFKQRHYREAVAAYDRCIKLEARYAEAWLNRGEAKRVLGDIKGACKDWHQVLRIDSGPLAELAQNWIAINCE